MPRKTNEQIFEEAERAAVLDAIGETEQEIFDDALNLDPDDNDGDRSLEEMDGEEFEDEDTEEEDEGNGEETAEQEGEGDEGEETPPETRQPDGDRQQDRRGVPPARLREETERRRAIEAEREQARAEARELRARLEAVERGQQRPPAQRREQTQSEAPDMFADPEGWAQHQRALITQDFETKRINASFADAEDAHGDSFRTAFQDLQRTNNPGLVREIVGSHNPGRALMNWHSRQALMSEIGNDPAAYRERVRQELLADPETRRAVITGARGEALRGEGGRPRTQTRLPPSLNSATGGTSHRSGMTSRDTARTTRSVEQEIFDSVWD